MTLPPEKKSPPEARAAEQFIRLPVAASREQLVDKGRELFDRLTCDRLDPDKDGSSTS